MIIKHKYTKYEVKLCDGTKYYLLKVCQLFIRIKRFCKRSLKNCLRVLPVVPIVCILTFLFIYCGIKMGFYDSILKGLWELKTFIVSTIIIPIITYIAVEEKKRKKELITQKSLYDYFSFESSIFLDNVIKQFYPDADITVDFERSCLFPDDSDLLHNAREKYNKDELLFYFEEYIRIVDNLNYRLGTQEIYGRLSEEKHEEMLSLKNELFNIIFELKGSRKKTDFTMTISDIENLYFHIFWICARLRDPWRIWDKKLNEQIKCIINKGTKIQ